MRRSLLLVLLVSGLTCFVGLGRAAITDSDEAYYAEAGREMRESGDYLSPRYNYVNRWQKPVLYYWGVVAAYAVDGVTEAAARFPAALSGVGLAIVAWAFGRRWFDEETGRLAGLVSATSLGPVTVARLALPDLPLAFFISLAIAAALEGAVRPARAHAGWMALAGAAAGAAFLTKGPVGLVLPALVVGAVVLVERRWSAFAPGPLAAAVVAALVIGLPWYAAMAQVHGRAYLESFFVGDNLERFATDRFNDPRPVWFYLPIVVGGALPWTPFAAQWIGPGLDRIRRRTWPDRPVVWLVAWAALPLALFTASIGKQPRYVLPVLLPLALGFAVSIRAALTRDPVRGTGALRGSAVAAGLVVGLAGAVLAAMPPEPLGVSPAVILGGAALSIASGLAVVAAAVWRPPWIPAALTSAGVIVILSAQLGLLSAPGPDRVQDVAAAVRAHLEPGSEWTAHEVFVRNLVFYVGQRQQGPFDEAGLAAWLGSGRPVLAVLAETDLVRIRPRVRVPLYTVGAWRYFNVAGIRAGMLLDRNPTRRVRTVVLVSSRPPSRAATISGR